MLAAVVGAGEEMIFAPERDRPDCALDDIGVDLDTAVVEEASKAVPARERVADCSGDGRFAGDGGKLGLEPKTQIVEERLGAALPRLATFEAAVRSCRLWVAVTTPTVDVKRPVSEFNRPDTTCVMMRQRYPPGVGRLVELSGM